MSAIVLKRNYQLMYVADMLDSARSRTTGATISFYAGGFEVDIW